VGPRVGINIISRGRGKKELITSVDSKRGRGKFRVQETDRKYNLTCFVSGRGKFYSTNGRVELQSQFDRAGVAESRVRRNRGVGTQPSFKSLVEPSHSEEKKSAERKRSDSLFSWAAGEGLP